MIARNVDKKGRTLKKVVMPALFYDSEDAIDGVLTAKRYYAQVV